MARYVDGFVMIVKKKDLKAYQKMARQGAKLWKKYGALEYVECLGHDLHGKNVMFPFTKLARTKPSEVVVFSWIVYKSKAQRDAINAKVMNDPSMAPENFKGPMPFDMKRSANGGFKVIVEA